MNNHVHMQSANWPQKSDAGNVAPAVPVVIDSQAMEMMRSKIGTTGVKAPIAKKKKVNKNYDNQGWAEVLNLHRGCSDLLRVSLMLTPLLRHAPLRAHIEDKQLMVRTISSITRDTQVLDKELLSIGNFVESKRKKCRGQGEILEAAQVCFQHYVNHMERFDSALLPSVIHASEQLTTALNSYRKEDAVTAAALESTMNDILVKIGAIVRDTIGSNTQH